MNSYDNYVLFTDARDKNTRWAKVMFTNFLASKIITVHVHGSDGCQLIYLELAEPFFPTESRTCTGS